MSKHAMSPKRDHTSTNTMYHLASACREGGDGQCDGWLSGDWGASAECNCPCHAGRGTFANAQTIEQMEQAHADYNRISLSPERVLTGAHRKA